MSDTINFKRGGTFSYGCLVLMPTGTWSAAAKLRDKAGVLMDTFTVTLTAPVNPETKHTLLIVQNATSTAAWPLERLQGDVVFTDASSPPVKLPTSTFFLNIVDLMTR